MFIIARSPYCLSGHSDQEFPVSQPADLMQGSKEHEDQNVCRPHNLLVGTSKIEAKNKTNRV